jgi:ribonuclease D
LNPRQLAILESLLQYRKQNAAKKDRPLFKIIGSRSILKLVRTAPVTLNQMEKSGALSQKQIAMYGSDLLDCIKAAQAVPADKLPVYPRRQPPVSRPAAPNRVKKLKRWRDKLAQRLGLDAGLLMNKALLHTIASQNPISLKTLEHIGDMKDWQRDTFGKDIVGLLSQRQRTV